MMGQEEDGGLAQYILLAVASVQTIRLALEVFRYKTLPDYYKVGDQPGKTNWWKLGGQVYGYGSFTIWALAAVSQVTAIFDVAPFITFLVWTFGVVYGITALGLLNAVFSLISYDDAHTTLMVPPPPGQQPGPAQ